MTGTAPVTGTMTAGEAFASLIEDHLVTAGYALTVLDCAEAVYPAPYYAKAPRGVVTILFASAGDVTLTCAPVYSSCG